MTALEILEEARKLIEAPERWCQGSYQSSCGTRRCAEGAVFKFDRHGSIFEALDALDTACGDQRIVAFNDTHTHTEVLTVFDKAIEAERAKAA